MNRTTFSRLMAVAIGIIIVVASLTSGFSAFAADPTEAGTEEKGMAGSTTLYTKHLQNGDFSKGLKYWTSTSGTSTADEFVTLKTEGTNKYIQFTIDTAISGYNGIISNDIIIPAAENHLKVGDTVAVMYDYNGTTAERSNFQVVATQSQCTGTAGSANAGGIQSAVFHAATYSNPFATYYNFNSNPTSGWISKPVAASTVVADTAKGTAAGDFVFKIKINTMTNKALTASFDNIRLVKYDATAKKFYSLEDGSEITSPEITDADNFIYGTKEKGMLSKDPTVGGINYYKWKIKPLDGPMNLDFQQGFRAWGGRDCSNGGDGTYPSDSYKLVTEGANTYIKLLTVAEGIAQTPATNDAPAKPITGILTPLFKLGNVKVGDKITTIFDYKGDVPKAKIQVSLQQVAMQNDYTNGGHWNLKALTTGFASQGVELKLSSTPSGWTTNTMMTYNPLVLPSTLVEESVVANYSQTIYAQVSISISQPDAAADISIDNIRIAKVSADGKVYTDVVTNTVIYDANAAKTGTGTGTGGTTGTGASSGTSNKTGDSIMMLAALFFVSGAGVFGTAKALKNR